MGKNKSLPAIVILLMAFLVSGFMAIAFSSTYNGTKNQTAVSTGTVDATESSSMMTAEQRFSRRDEGQPRLFIRQALGSVIQKVLPCYSGSCIPRGIIVVAALVFAALIIAPFLFGLIELSNPRDALTPFIDPTYVKDARFFDRSFWEKLSKALGGDFTPGIREMTLSKKETVEVAGPYTVKAGESREHILYVGGTLAAGNDTVFRKEVYVTGSAEIGAGSALRAIASGKDISFGSGTQVIRWAGAEGNMAIGERCLLGVRTLCEGTMKIGKGCSFQYLHGAPIRVYADPSFAGRKGLAPVEKNIEEAAWHIGKSCISIPPYTAVEKDMVVEGSISIKRGCTVKGSIKAYGNIVLGEGVTVDGDLFAENVIDIGERCVIRGNVFTQGEVFISGGTTIGGPGQIKTVVGKKEVQLFHDCVVYGHVTTQGIGIVI